MAADHKDRTTLFYHGDPQGNKIGLDEREKIDKEQKEKSWTDMQSASESDRKKIHDAMVEQIEAKNKEKRV